MTLSRLCTQLYKIFISLISDFRVNESWKCAPHLSPSTEVRRPLKSSVTGYWTSMAGVASSPFIYLKVVFHYYFRYRWWLTDSPVEPCCWDGVEGGTVGWDHVPNLVAGEASWYHRAVIRKVCNKTVIIMTPVCQSSLPTTLRKFWFLAVWKSGASPDTSHR